VQERIMSTKQASRLAAGATLAAPVVGLATGAVAGRKAKKKLDSERKRIKMWRGEDGAFVVVRAPKEKKAFDEKLQACLLATGRDVDKVAEAYEAELEKISSITRGLLMGGGALAERALGGAARAVGFTGRAAKNVARDIVPDAARAAGGTVRAVRGAGAAGTGAASRAARAVRRTGENIADRAQAARANISRNFQAGVTGASPAQVKELQALKGRQAAMARQIQAQRASRGAMAAPSPTVTAANQVQAQRAARGALAAPQGAPSVAPAAPQAPGAVTQAAQAVAGEGAQQAAPGLLQQAQNAVSQRYNLGALQGQPVSAQGVSQWFGKLNPQQQAELAAMMGVGAAGAGFVGGAATS
jgi:uncharacterized protein